MKKLLTIALVVAMMLTAFAYAEDFPKIDGSTATLPLSYALMCKFTGCTQEEAEAQTEHNTTSTSFYCFASGDADLLLVYEPSQEAWDALNDEGVEYEKKAIGLDAPVFLINDTNPIESLTQQQIVDIYSGKITNWSEVGGADLPIIAYQRSEDSGSQVMVRAQVMKDVEMADAPHALKPDEMGELIDDIASYRNTADAIGYSVYFYVHNMYMQDGIKLLSVDGVAPSTETIASGEYPYSQPFYAIIRADAAEDSPERQVYDFLSTEEGKQMIADCGYVPVSEE